MALRVAEEWLSSCSGCEIAILNLGAGLLELLRRIELVHIPVLLDHKYFGPLGDGDPDHPDIPEAEVGIISGGVRDREQLETAKLMRQRCGTIVALGTCATHGGIPALINQSTNAELFERYYRGGPTTDPGPDPDQVVPPMLERTYALDEHITVDLYLPGCPPHPDQIAEALTALVQGRDPVLPRKSVCDTCPTIREGKGQLSQVARLVDSPKFDPDQPLSQMRCLLEQGLLCMGPVTAAGCAGSREMAPRCLSARVPCRGCYGPVRRQGNQMLDMLNALASNGVELGSLVDRPGLLRFSGAHGRLRPRPAPRKSGE